TLVLISCAKQPDFEILIKNGKIVDGSGNEYFIGDVAINADTIAAIGNLKDRSAKQEIDAAGLVVAPGFINMLSWAASSLDQDGRSMSDIKQGVTLEVFGEGTSMGPTIKKNTQNNTTEVITLKEKLDALVEKGISTNIASF